MTKKTKQIDLTAQFDYSLVDKDGVASSPLADFPGSVVLPMFSFGVFKKWRESLAKHVSNETGKQELAFYFDKKLNDGKAKTVAAATENETEDGENAEPGIDSELRYVDVNYAKVAIDIAKSIKIDGLGDDWRDDPFNNLHYTVLVWLAMIVVEWSNRQITFRRSIA